jgi:hypothetical protein
MRMNRIAVRQMMNCSDEGIAAVRNEVNVKTVRAQACRTDEGRSDEGGEIPTYLPKTFI